MKIRFFQPGLTYKKYKKEFDKAFKKTMSEGQLILRKDVEDFEKWLAEYTGTKYAVALNSCTDALYLALRALKIGPGDEVLVPSRTFVATAQVIVQVGATPVFYDLDGRIKEKITSKTRAIIPVHIEGHFDDHFAEILELSKEFNELAGQYNFHIIEDAAQALGATYQGKKAGSFGIAGCFSFYPAKILGAFGDAGGLTTNDEEMYKYIKDVRNHFKDDARDWGVNSRLDNLQAALLNVRTPHIDEMLEMRREIACMYSDELRDIEGLQLPPHTEGRQWQDYIIRTSKRNELFAFLKENGVETLKNNYPFPVPKLPLAQAYEDETLRLPCNENLTKKEIHEVIRLIKKFYE